jgi:hypothetical protein
VVGAIVQLGSCFDLMDTKFTDELAVAYDMLAKLHERRKQPLPQNEGKSADKIMRHLDCAVLNLYLTYLEEKGSPVRVRRRRASVSRQRHPVRGQEPPLRRRRLSSTIDRRWRGSGS